MHHTSSFVCCVDASWLDSQSRAGIGWILYNPQGRRVLRGFSSVAPVATALEVEALALKEALFHLRRLNYVDVTFCDDSMLLYRHLEKIKKMPHSVPGCLEIQSYLDDITALSLNYFAFKFICRNDNSAADLLAKSARSQNLPFTISWEY
ncbi:unnamed protein product [Arabidopsis arenosa]|uniref:RNase H type-1 domain-containing protein n=1 Tax=Arabidopsis arenosa TaxID=38785 RepID=A0A8S2AEX0_ARAAE|nr:unnamed protein product [Arabidopsis arenosa]